MSAPNGQGYDLSLVDGQTWNLVASEEAGAWLAKMARIMELKRGESARPRKVVYLRGPFSDNLEDLIARNHLANNDNNRPADGWKYYKSGVGVWYHDTCPDAYINLGPVYIRQQGGDNDITEEQHDVSHMALSFFPFFRRCVDLGGMPFHAGLVSRDGKAVLLAAPGGTGKSTCCRRILGKWKAISDDEALIVATGNGTYQTHPFPTWSDYLYERNKGTWNTSSHLPLSAIFFLEQARADEAVPLKNGIAVSYIYQSSMQAYNRCLMGMDIPTIRKMRNAIFDNACTMAKTVPAFRLQVCLTGQFWENIEEVMPEFKK